MIFKKFVFTISFFVFTINCSFAQKDCSFLLEEMEEDIYGVVNEVFKESGYENRIKILSSPISFSQVINDSLLQILVRKKIIHNEDLNCIKLQIENCNSFKWESRKLKSSVTTKRVRALGANGEVYGLSIPVFSENKNVALIYYKLLNSNDVSEGIAVYVRGNEKWEFSFMLFSIIS
jgi:hypothetical protein